METIKDILYKHRKQQTERPILNEDEQNILKINKYLND